MNTDYYSSTLNVKELLVLIEHCKRQKIPYCIDNRKLHAPNLTPANYFSLQALELYCITQVV